jgi:hypothetical protein
MPAGWATTDLVAGLRGRASPSAAAALPAAGRVWLTRFRCDGTVHGHERLPYLSRMCRSVASVVAQLTRVRPEAEGAIGQDRPGPGRIPAIAPHRSRNVHQRFLAALDA